jgi:hypothetical protein
VRWIAAAALLAGWLSVGSVAGEFVASTGNGANALASAPAPLPATDFTVDVDLNVIPPSCTATLEWTLSATASVDGYEIERVRKLDGAVVGGPWTVGPSVTTHVDAGIPLQVLGQAYVWRIRATDGDWHSAPATSSDFDLLLCALL